MHSRNELGKRKHLSWVLSYVPHYNQHPNHQRHCYKLKRPEWAAFITSANAQGKGTRTWTAAIAAYIQPTFKAGGSCSQRTKCTPWARHSNTVWQFFTCSCHRWTLHFRTWFVLSAQSLGKVPMQWSFRRSHCWAAQGSNVPCTLLNARSQRVKGLQLLISFMLVARTTSKQISKNTNITVWAHRGWAQSTKLLMPKLHLVVSRQCQLSIMLAFVCWLSKRGPTWGS